MSSPKCLRYAYRKHICSCSRSSCIHENISPSVACMYHRFLGGEVNFVESKSLGNSSQKKVFDSCGPKFEELRKKNLVHSSIFCQNCRGVLSFSVFERRGERRPEYPREAPDCVSCSVYCVNGYICALTLMWYEYRKRFSNYAHPLRYFEWAIYVGETSSELNKVWYTCMLGKSVCLCCVWKTKRNTYLPIYKYTKWQMLAVIHTNKTIFPAEISAWLTSFQQQNISIFTQKSAIPYSCVTLISLEQHVCPLPMLSLSRFMQQLSQSESEWKKCTNE